MLTPDDNKKWRKGVNMVHYLFSPNERVHLNTDILSFEKNFLRKLVFSIPLFEFAKFVIVQLTPASLIKIALDDGIKNKSFNNTLRYIHTCLAFVTFVSFLDQWATLVCVVEKIEVWPTRSWCWSGKSDASWRRHIVSTAKSAEAIDLERLFLECKTVTHRIHLLSYAHADKISTAW